MPVRVNKIGDFEFLAIEGEIFRRQMQLEIIRRPGVDGNGLRRLGKMGKEFQVVTVNYVASFKAAKTLMDQYIAEIAGADGQFELIRHSVDHGDYFVLEARESQPQAIFSALGGFDGGEECLHQVTWTLLG